MANKSVQDMQTEMVSALNRLIPEMDLSEGSPERDVLVEAPISGQLINLWSRSNYTSQLYAPIANYQYLTDSDVELYCSNFNITRISATKSSGYVTFYTSTMPTKDILIKVGTLVSTVSSPQYYFVVTSAFSVSITNLASYFNASNNRWEFNVYVEAQKAGSTYRAGANTVTSLESAITGIDGVINSSAITGGADAESNYSMLQRLINSFQSRGILNKLGISNYIANSVTSVVVVGAGDSLMTRDLGRGGCVDIYIQGLLSATQTDTYTITTAGLISGSGSNYTSTTITLSKPPVYTVSQVLINGSAISNSYYELVVDTGDLKKSTSASDKIRLTDAGISALTGFKSGSTVSITYTYNKLLYDLTTSISSTTNKVLGRNYLLREQIPTAISISVPVAAATGYTIDGLKSSWDTILYNYLSSLSHGAKITKSGIVSVLKGISTMTNFDMSSLYICTTASGIPSSTNTSSSITLDDSCYPVLGSTYYTEWNAE